MQVNVTFQEQNQNINIELSENNMETNVDFNEAVGYAIDKVIDVQITDISGTRTVVINKIATINLTPYALVSNSIDISSAQNITGIKNFSNGINIGGDSVKIFRNGSYLIFGKKDGNNYIEKLGVGDGRINFYVDLEPNTNNTIDIGSSSSKFKDLYLNGYLKDGINSINISSIADAVSKKHEHTNKALLDTYTQTENNLADAVLKKHAHTNISILNGISSTDISNWNSKQPAINSTNKLNADYIQNGSTNKVITQTEKDIWNAKTSINDASTSSVTETWSANKLNTTIGNIEVLLEALL